MDDSFTETTTNLVVSEDASKNAKAPLKPAAPQEAFDVSSLPSLEGIRIAYDMSHNTGRQGLTSPTGGNANSTIFGDFMARGATIDVITTFTPSVLRQYDVLWLEEDWNTPLTPTEKVTLSQYVAAGGSVLIVGDEWAIYSSDPASPLKVFGFNYVPVSFSGVTTNITPDPITAGVNSVYVSFAVNTLSVPPDATVLVRDPSGTLNLVAALHFGEGRVGVSADELCINGVVEQEDNRLLCNNMMTYLALGGRKRLIESATLFEAGLASILQAESEKIEAVLEGLPEDTEFTERDLMLANRNLNGMVADLLALESRIIEKIRLQQRL